MERGYIKLWRKSIESAVFSDPLLWKLWCMCLMKARHKEKYVSIEGIKEPIKLCAGQFITGRFSLHSDFYSRKKKDNKSPLTLWRMLQTLEKLGSLNIKSLNKYSVISICNWNDYQQTEQQLEQHVNNRRTTDEQQMNTKKNVKNVKENKDTEYSEKFLLFWDEYPNKQGKAKAFTYWKKYKCDNGIFQSIMESLDKFKKSDSWNKDGGKYIPHGNTWVYNKRWEDEINTAPKTNEWGEPI